MKVYLKKLLKNKSALILLIVFVLAFAVRFYNFPDRVTFWSEQARSLVVSANYIKEKPSLLGQEYFRVASNGHKVFSGAVFNYMLVPLLLISGYDPVVITIFFALLNIFTGLAVYLVAKRVFGRTVSVFSTILFLFNDMMVYHSLFIWNYNLLPLVGVLSFYLLTQKNKKFELKNIFFLGFLSGLGISFQILYLLVALSILIFVIWKSKEKFKSFIVFASGVLIGNLPMVLFDIRHNFYNLTALWQYTLDTIKGVSDSSFSYYYLLPFWPVAIILGSYILSKIYKANKYLALIITAAYLFLNLTSSRISFNNPTGMPEGLTAYDIAKASEVISKDVHGDFNVAEVLDFDKRAYVLRYYVEFVYGKKPLSEIDYVNPGSLYVLSQIDYNFGQSGVWEINAGGPYNITNLSDIGQGYAVYKLQE